MYRIIIEKDGKVLVSLPVPGIPGLRSASEIAVNTVVLATPVEEGGKQKSNKSLLLEKEGQK